MIDKRWAVIAAALALCFGAGCGSDDEPAAGDGAAQADGDAAQERTIQHDMGTTAITGTPERVVVLDTGELDTALALGVTPVGSVEVSTGSGFPSYLADQTEGIEPVGTIAEPSLETIASLQPDLILSSTLRHEAIYDQLSQIAPTVFAETVGVSWRENFELFAEAMNRTDQADKLLAEYDAAAQEFQQAMGDEIETLEVSVIRSMPDEVRIMGKASFVGTVLEDAGLQRPPAQDGDFFAEEGTAERIPDMDGDVMFLAKFGDEHERLEAIQERPAWSRLEAVQNDRVIEVPDDTWMLGIGIIAARKVVDDLERLLG